MILFAAVYMPTAWDGIWKKKQKTAAISPMNNLISFLPGPKNLQHEGIFTAATFAHA